MGLSGDTPIFSLPIQTNSTTISKSIPTGQSPGRTVAPTPVAERLHYTRSKDTKNPLPPDTSSDGSRGLV